MSSVRRELTADEKKLIINLNNNNSTQQFIASTLNVSQSCISKFLKRWKCRRSVENLHRTGRPPKSDSKGDRRIIRHVKTHRKQTLAEITNCVNNILPQQPLSSRTVRRRLRSSGFTRRKIRKQIVISRVNRAHHMTWCRQKLTWKIDDWKSVIFSDETQVVIRQNRKVYIWRKPHEVWRPECLGGGKCRKISAMIWGCICYQ